MFIQIALSILGAMVLDWAFCGRLAAMATYEGYKYRLSARRLIILIILIAWLNYLFYIANPQKPWLLGVLIFSVFFLIYGTIMAMDVYAQKNNEVLKDYRDRD